jgi:hypothetical protein
MAKHTDIEPWLWIGGAAAIGYVIYQSLPQATPLSIYPEYAYTAQTSMAANPKQVAATAAIPPESLFTATQNQAQSAILAQCAGSWPTCTPLMGDTQLGF